MPQRVDLESLVCGGGDGKVACESSMQEEAPVSTLPAKVLESPAASFRLSIKDGIEWIDFTPASFFERDDSTKEITNPKSVAHHNVSGNLGASSRANSSSQRFSGKPKAPIIALPNKLRHSGYLGHSRRHAPIFPKKGQKSSAKPAVPEFEPTSPKVSCFGRVLSERDRRRCCRKTQAASRDSSSPSLTASSSPRRKRSRMWFIICKLFCFGRKTNSPAIDFDGELPSYQNATATNSTMDRSTGSGEFETAAPGLGAMKRFASGRRSRYLDKDLDLSVQSGTLTHDDEGILRRRAVVSLRDLDCDGDWKNSGPASV